MTCPHCHGSRCPAARTIRNALRIGASLLLFPLYVLGGLAGDDRGPLLPLEHRCLDCGRAFKERSVVDQVASWAGLRPRR